VQDELYSIGREALTSAVRHAQATEIALELNYDVMQIILVCRDNGRGLEAEIVRAGVKSGHWGIPGMRERARSLGCKLELASSAESGTRIQVCVEWQKAYLDYESRPGWDTRFLRGLMPVRRAAQDEIEKSRRERVAAARASGTAAESVAEHPGREPQTSKASLL
jgi:hypothetical protein